MVGESLRLQNKPPRPGIQDRSPSTHGAAAVVSGPRAPSGKKPPSSVELIRDNQQGLVLT
jgi:hypothetical protein